MKSETLSPLTTALSLSGSSMEIGMLTLQDSTNGWMNGRNEAKTCVVKLYKVHVVLQTIQNQFVSWRISLERVIRQQ
jgi:hypothetical protein